MPITDALLLVSNAQTVTGTDTTVLSTDKIDLLSNRDIGEGRTVFARFYVTTAFSGGTSVDFQAVTADNAALSTNLLVIGSTGPIAIASLPVNTRLAVAVRPRIGSNGQRYLGVRYALVGAVAAGAVTADFGLEIQDGAKFYPSGFTVQ